MLLTFLADSVGGGTSRLGGIIQKGLRIVRQGLHGEKRGVVPISEQNFSRVQKFRSSSVVPAVGSNVFSVVRRGAHEILCNYLARNQIDNIVTVMRRRYAVRFMSGSARFYTGLSNRIAIYGFVGVSFGGAVHNQFCHPVEESCSPCERTIQDLLEEKSDNKVFSKPLLEVDTKYLSHDFRRQSISEESDIVILTDEESDIEVIDEENAIEVIDEENDIEVIEPAEIVLFASPVNEVEVFEEDELKELIEMETRQSKELCCLVQTLSQENALLKEMIRAQAVQDELLKSELRETLETVDEQRKVLGKLRGMIQQQNIQLQNSIVDKRQLNQKISHDVKVFGQDSGLNKVPSSTKYAKHNAEYPAPSFTKIDMESLRAEGGRVRALKVHRKQRFKNV